MWRPLILLTLLAACAGRSPTPIVAAPEGQVVVLQGVVTYTPLPPTKSLEAWLSQDLTLVDGDRRWDLSGTAEIPDEVIASFDGKRVQVTAVAIPERAPESWESAPMGLDGPMMRPATWQVTAITALP